MTPTPPYAWDETPEEFEDKLAWVVADVAAKPGLAGSAYRTQFPPTRYLKEARRRGLLKRDCSRNRWFPASWVPGMPPPGDCGDEEGDDGKPFVHRHLAAGEWVLDHPLGPKSIFHVADSDTV